MSTNWKEIAIDLADECPSQTLRRATVRVLERAALIGPLRAPREEFRRVYQFLHWNEEDRVLAVVNAILERTKGTNPQTIVRANAWGYVVSVLDEWITQARVFYLVSGILESTLRARLNAHLTDKLETENWPDVSDAAPSALREFAPKQEQRDEQLLQIHALLEQKVPDTAEAKDGLIAAIREAVAPKALESPRDGSEFVRHLSFGALRMFFERKKTWEGKIDLQSVFRGRDGKSDPPLRDKVTSVLKTLNDARNEVAHYRPKRFLTFEQPLFDAALLASWLGEDLQHVYSSIDSRESTELSILLGALAQSAKWSERVNDFQCGLSECRIARPYDWLLGSAPRARDELDSVHVVRACLYHRVQIRSEFHRPKTS